MAVRASSAEQIETGSRLKCFPIEHYGKECMLHPHPSGSAALQFILHVISESGTSACVWVRECSVAYFALVSYG